MHFSVESVAVNGSLPAASHAQVTRKGVARVLVADRVLPSRLALKSILSTAGYAVTGAATSAEAMRKLDEGEYQLVLADLRAESEQAGPGVLAYARQKEFRPATMLIESEMSRAMELTQLRQPVQISNDDVCALLDRVASLIGDRADRRSKRAS
jgi:CheY-like chemotaxis protein